MLVYSSKTRRVREVELVPSHQWGGQGLLGVSIRSYAVECRIICIIEEWINGLQTETQSCNFWQVVSWRCTAEPLIQHTFRSPINAATRPCKMKCSPYYNTLPCYTKSTTAWSTLISHPSLHWHSPVLVVMHPVSFNHSAAVRLISTRSFLVLFGTGMYWRWIHYFFTLLMPSRTTSSLIHHLITSVFNLINFVSAGNMAYPATVHLSLRSRTLNGRRTKNGPNVRNQNGH